MKILDEALDLVIIEFFKIPLQSIYIIPDYYKDRTGVYGIYLGIDLVYIGSTKNNSGCLYRRIMSDHLNKIKKSIIDPHDVCVRIIELAQPASVEDEILKRYNPPWNGQGFGNHALGKNRVGQRIPEWEVIYLLKDSNDNKPRLKFKRISNESY